MVVDHYENERSNFVEFSTKLSRIQEFVNFFEDVLPTAHYTQIPIRVRYRPYTMSLEYSFFESHSKFRYTVNSQAV